MSRSHYKRWIKDGRERSVREYKEEEENCGVKQLLYTTTPTYMLSRRKAVF
jgi:hypothetical protein